MNYDFSTAAEKVPGQIYRLNDQQSGFQIHSLENEEMLNLVSEHVLTIYVNETPMFQTTCSPFQLKELAVGRLLSEGLIRSFEEIESIALDNSNSSIRIRLKKTMAQPKELSALRPIVWNKNDIRMLQDTLKHGLPLHRMTHAVHAAILARDSQILCCAEDIGRHNALDKVIGYAAVHDISLSSCILFSSGRVPTDMVSKTIRAGIPVLIGNGAPTIESVRLAKQYQLELVRCIPDNQVIIY